MINLSFPWFSVVVGLNLFLGVGTALSERPDNRFWQTVRMIQDAPVLSQKILEKRGITALVPVLIKPGTVQRGPRGLMIVGEMDVLDFGNLSAPVRTVSYATQLRDMPRQWREEGKVYSPYIHNGGMAVCEINPEFDTGTLTEFPKTYVLSPSWIEQLGALGATLTDPASFAEMMGRDIRSLSGAEVMIYLAASSQGDQKLLDLSPMLESGDLDSRALVVMKLLMRDVNGEPGKIATWLEKNANPTNVAAVALGAVAYVAVFRGSESKLAVLTNSIERLSKNQPDKAADLAKFVKFLQDK